MSDEKTLQELREENERLKARIDELESTLGLLRRYHFGDGTISRNDVLKALQKPTDEDHRNG